MDIKVEENKEQESSDSSSSGTSTEPVEKLKMKFKYKKHRSRTNKKLKEMMRAENIKDALRKDGYTYLNTKIAKMVCKKIFNEPLKLLSRKQRESCELLDDTERFAGSETLNSTLQSDRRLLRKSDSNFTEFFADISDSSSDDSPKSKRKVKKLSFESRRKRNSNTAKKTGTSDDEPKPASQKNVAGEPAKKKIKLERQAYADHEKKVFEMFKSFNVGKTPDLKENKPRIQQNGRKQAPIDRNTDKTRGQGSKTKQNINKKELVT